MITQLRGYMKGLNFNGLRANAKLNPFVVLNSNTERQLNQKQLGKTRLNITLNGGCYALDTINERISFLIFNFIKQNNNCVRLNLENLCEVLNKYYQTDISLATIRRRMAVLTRSGFVIKYKADASNGNHTYSYMIDLPTIKNHYPDFERKYMDLLQKFNIFPGKKKSEQIISKNNKEKTLTVYKQSTVKPVSSAVVLSFNNFLRFKEMKRLDQAINNVANGVHLSPIEPNFKPDLYTWRWCTETKAVPEFRLNFILKKFVDRHLKDKDKSDDWSMRFKSFVQKCLQNNWYNHTEAKKTSKTEALAQINDIQPEVVKLQEYATSAGRDKYFINYIAQAIKAVEMKDGLVHVYLHNASFATLNGAKEREWTGLLSKVSPYNQVGVECIKFGSIKDKDRIINQTVDSNYENSYPL